MLKFTADRVTLTSPPSCGLSCELFEEDRIAELHQLRGFTHALGFDRDPARPDKLGCVAWSGGSPAGVAGVSADGDDFWQVGVDVQPEHRGRGVARELVHRVTEAVLAREKVPYYSTYPSNLVSSNVAVAVGYRLSWLELETRPG